MLFWKRLCRHQGEPPAAATTMTPSAYNTSATSTTTITSTSATSSVSVSSRPRARSVSWRERRFFGALRSGKRKNAAPPIYCQHAGAVETTPVSYREAPRDPLENVYILEAPVDVPQLRLRSPPPLYSPQPLTPPPCYSERPVAPEPARSAPADRPHQPAEYAATTTPAARQQARRRRRLRELQEQQLQQQQQQLVISSSTSNSSSDQSSASDCELGVRQQRQRRRSSRGLRDAYCPDLLHACALILRQQQPGSSDSSVGNFTATPPPTHSQSQSVAGRHEYSSDYVEIDELLPPLGAGPKAKSTPHLQNAVGINSLAMGQNLSLRRPRISLTWVLREQHQQQPTAQQPTNEPEEQQHQQKTKELKELPLMLTNSHVIGESIAQRTNPVPTQLDVCNKRYRVKQLPDNGQHNDSLTGYATTPTVHLAPSNGQLTNKKFFSNQNLLEYKDKASTIRNKCAQEAPGGTPPVAAASTKELLFVCTPQRAPKSDVNSEVLQLARKRNEIRKKLANRLQQARATTAVGSMSCTPVPIDERSITVAPSTTDALKCTISEPSLVAVSEGGGGSVGVSHQQRRHRHRKRRERERQRVQRFGYEIHNVDEFLTRCSLAAPGNIPVVLATASTLYQTRPGGYQLEIPLPLGMVVNAVFKNQNWLYVQTPHAEEGYVGYACCLPLGILPSAARGSRHAPCWESNADIFPRPCGNMTDSEKEIRLRGGTRSDGARTPHSSKATTEELLLHNHNNNNNISNNNNNSKNQVANGGGSSLSGSLYGEQHVDKLYLRAASQPKLVEKAYAQLRSTKQIGSGAASTHNVSNDEYVTLQQRTTTTKSTSSKVTSKQPPPTQAQNHLHQVQAQTVRRLSNVSYITNGHNGQHLHPNSNPSTTQGSLAHNVLRRHQQNGLRQTLVAINSDYITESIVVHKGEIVTLCECRESKDQRQWFYVRTRDGREGFIPAEVAGHGYL
ncbi:uncharacterized protein LOC133846297 isoform X1 [Drosophila sulfurigaster albostrigata]|uniref:uncharacterized protein LOC133846297 isoform X1 n=1 Tax=Drosophila sulfurigaster albostrigata TaxID=89887 RepID=UPI002D218B58|nr:uncharacterized protein LOC133846297 isoform X1 [Drosophila sulfurigaster albostrigata]